MLNKLYLHQKESFIPGFLDHSDSILSVSCHWFFTYHRFSSLKHHQCRLKMHHMKVSYVHYIHLRNSTISIALYGGIIHHLATPVVQTREEYCAHFVI